MTLLENKPVKFYEYLSSHPHLYDGVELTKNEIDWLNNEFWMLDVNPATFDIYYLQEIRKYIAQYKNMKAIEFCDKIFDITTNKSVRTIAENTTNKLNSTSSGTSGSTTSETSNGSSSSDNKNAEKQLPMKSTGEDFEETVNWENGASGISETKNTASNSNTASTTVSANDKRLLSNLGEGTNNSQDEFEAVNEAAVDIITRIWNYLIQPKALQWLADQLQHSFILIL